MKEVSIFVDESGDLGTVSKYYLVTLLFHDQDDLLQPHLDRYEQILSTSNLLDIPFHLSPLMNGHGDYEGIDIQTRKRMLSKFVVFTQNLPFAYKSFSFKKSDFTDSESMLVHMKRDVILFLFDHLDYFQRYDKVKIYYDDGQHAITQMLNGAIEYAIAKDAYLFKEAHPQDYRLSQVADYLCGIELTAIKYEQRESTATDDTIFGGSTSFKKNYLRKVRKKQLR